MEKIVADDVLSRVVDIEPIGAVYTIVNQQIEEFVYHYLTVHKHISGVQAVRFTVINEGDITRGIKPKISLLAFFNINSPDVVSDLSNIPQHLRDLMDSESLRASQKLYDAVLPIINKFQMGAFPKEHEAYIKLDLFRVIGLMFDAQVNVHQINIIDVKNTGKNRSVVMFAKTEIFTDQSAGNAQDKYSRLSQRLAHNEYDRSRD